MAKLLLSYVYIKALAISIHSTLFRSLIMRILITGGAGFIGSHTANQFALASHEVNVFDNLNTQVHESNTQFPAYLHSNIIKVKGDIRDFHAISYAIKDQEVIYHLASLTGVGQSMYQVKEYIDVNCNGTANLVEAIIHAKHKPKKVILSSSRAIYGEGNHLCTKCNHTTWNTRKTEKLNAGNFEIVCPLCQNLTTEVSVEETRTPNPLSVYAETKRNQEEYLKYLPQFHGVPLTILRYFNVYGSQQSLKNPYTGILTVFFNQVQYGQKINIYEDGKPTRDFVHVDDVVQANLLALKFQHNGTEIFNIGSGKNYLIREAAEILSKACKKKAEIKETNTLRAGDILACTANIDRSYFILGFKPQVSLKKGIEEFVQWAKEQKSSDQYDSTVTELSKYNLIGNFQ